MTIRVLSLSCSSCCTIAVNNCFLFVTRGLPLTSSHSNIRIPSGPKSANAFSNVCIMMPTFAILIFMPAETSFKFSKEALLCAWMTALFSACKISPIVFIVPLIISSVIPLLHTNFWRIETSVTALWAPAANWNPKRSSARAVWV